MWYKSFKNQGHAASYFVSLVVWDFVHSQTLINTCWINNQLQTWGNIIYLGGFGAWVERRAHPASVHQLACPPTSPLPLGTSIICIDTPSFSPSQPICFGWAWMAPVGMWPNLENPSAQNLVNDLSCFVFWRQRTPTSENDFIQILPDGDIHNKLPSVAMVSPWKGWQMTIVQVILSSDTEEHLCSWLI